MHCVTQLHSGFLAEAGKTQSSLIIPITHPSENLKTYWKTLLMSNCQPHKCSGWHRGYNVQSAISTACIHTSLRLLFLDYCTDTPRRHFLRLKYIYSYSIFHKLKFIFLTKLFYRRHINHLHIQSLKVPRSVRENIFRPKEHLRKWSLW